MTPPALAVEITGLRFAYARRVDSFSLFISSLDLEQGRSVACIGPSGSGKTTLINLIAGIILPDAGEIVTAGERVTSMGDAARRAFRARRIGMVFQEFELLEYLSAFDNIIVPHRVSPGLRVTPEVRAHAAELAQSLGIAHVLKRRPSRLSQGERQRVGICRALITSPSLIICDEPTGNLDPRTADTTLDLIFEHARKLNAALLMVTHNHAVLSRFDRTIDIAELNAGSSRRADADLPAGPAGALAR